MTQRTIDRMALTVLLVAALPLITASLIGWVWYGPEGVR